MQIDPSVKIWIGGIAVILSVLSGCTSQFTTLFGQGEAQQIMAVLSISTGMSGALIMFLGGYSSSKPGPLAPPDAPVTVAATKLAGLPPGAPGTATAKADVIQAAEAH